MQTQIPISSFSLTDGNDPLFNFSRLIQMSHIINTYNLFLSSEHRTSGTSANYSVALHKPLALTNANNWFSVRVGSAEIPFTFPLINSTNNTLAFTLTRGGVPVVSSLVIGEGTYNINTLNDELSQIGFKNINSMVLHGFIEVNFLGDHGFGFYSL